MNSSKLFDNIDNVNVQIQKKRRKNEAKGMWGAPPQITNSFESEDNIGLNKVVHEATNIGGGMFV